MNLTKEARNQLPDDDFAVPGKRKLPIHDKAHIRLAWDMVDRTQDLSDEERKSARDRILRKAESFGIDTGDWLSASFVFQAMSMDVPEVADHPNRMPFEGILTRVDQPSDAPPGGSGGRRVIIPKDVAQAAIPSLLGMAVDCDSEGKFDGHDSRFKIGLITSADIFEDPKMGDGIKIKGYFYANDFPDLCEIIKTEKHRLGFSYEVGRVRIRDRDENPWVVTQCVFTGAAVLYKNKAAYTTTSLSASADSEIEIMTKEEMQALLVEAMKPLSEKLTAQGEEIAKLQAGKGAALAGPIVDQATPIVDACNDLAAKMEKAGIGTHPEMGHAREVRKIGAHIAAAAVSGHIPVVYRDHNYFSDNPKVEAAGKINAAELQAAVDAALKPMKDELAAANTKLTDLGKQAFHASGAPERKTITPEITALLAKASIDRPKEGENLNVHQVDKALEAVGINGTRAIEAKLKLQAAGLLSPVAA